MTVFIMPREKVSELLEPQDPSQPLPKWGNVHTTGAKCEVFEKHKVI